MRLVAVLLTVLSLTGCVTPGLQYSGGQMIPGRLVSLADGALIPLQIELSTGQGRITGNNLRTGELFNGDYTAIPDTRYTQYSKDTFLGTQEIQQAVEVGSSVPATAILIGDKGTVINITMRIKPGNGYVKPIGYGEGSDNKSVKYNFQF
jgi:hypothetical protein